MDNQGDNNETEARNIPPKYGRGENPNSLKNLKIFSSESQPENNGRPGGSRNLSTLLKEMLADIAPGEIINSKFVKEFCKGRKSITNADALTARLVSEGIIKGESWAIREILDRTEGRAAQSLNLSGNLSIKTFADLALEAEKEIIE